MNADQAKGTKEIPVLFEEMDGVWLNMQGKAHEKAKKHGMLDAYNEDGTLMAKVLFNKDEAIKGYSLNHGKDPVLMSEEELKLINEAY